MDHTLDNRTLAEEEAFEHEEGRQDEVLQMNESEEIDGNIPNAEQRAEHGIQESEGEMLEVSEDKLELENFDHSESVASYHEEAEDEEALNRMIEELCMSKAEEFALLGYEGITGKDIWEFVSEQYQEGGIPPLHRLINDILSLRVTQYMNWLTLSAYKGTRFHE